MSLIFTEDQDHSLARVAEIFSLPLEDLIKKFKEFMFEDDQRRFLTVDVANADNVRIPYEKWVSALSLFCKKVITPMFKPVYDAILAEKMKEKK